MQTQEFWQKIGEKLGLFDSPVFALAAPGEISKVEIARSGDFMDMNHRPVKLTAGNMASMASSFEATRDHKIKLGHEKITSATPDYGDVVGLEYDAPKDRLLASIKPTEALVEQNRKGAFKRVSMELGLKGDDGFAFEHLAFLGAKRPAVSGLAAVALSEGDPVVVCAMAPDEDTEPDPAALAEFSADERKKLAQQGIAMSDGSYPIRNKSDLSNAIQAFGRSSNPDATKAHIKKRAAALGAADMLPESWSQKRAAAAPDSEEQMSEEILAENKALKENLAKFAAADVKTFFESDAMKKRIPLGVADKLRRVMSALATREAEGIGGTVMLAESEAPASIYEGIKAVFAAWPEKLSEAETTETVKKGAEEPTADMAQFAGADEESVGVHLAATKVMAEEKAKGNVIDYVEGLRRVEMARGRAK